MAGDTHGNTRYLTEYLYPKAADLDADAFVQVGDFGFWDHKQPEGGAFLDAVDQAAEDNREIPLLFVRGNHDNLGYLREHYQHTTGVGFIEVRANVLYIPDGLVWTWGGHILRAFGGAYSVDKAQRLQMEAKRNRHEAHRAQGRRERQLPPEPRVDHTGSLWFPEEELTDAEMDALLNEYSGHVDVIFSHDKPASANPGMALKNFAECRFNQQRLQRALLAHQPSTWLHGHLHHFYTDTVRCGPTEDDFTGVVGLSCDDQAAMSFWKPWHSWCIVDLEPGKEPHVQLGCVLEDRPVKKRGQLAPPSVSGAAA